MTLLSLLRLKSNLNLIGWNYLLLIIYISILTPTSPVFLSSSPVLLNVGVGVAVLEVGVGVIGALPAEFIATTLMV